MCWSPMKNVTYEFVLSSPAVPSRSCSSYLDWLRNMRQVAVQLSFVCCCFHNFFKTAHSIIKQFPSSFFSECFVLVQGIQIVQPYIITDTATASQKPCFILTETTDFNVIDRQLMIVHTFLVRMLKQLSVDKILLPRYMNEYTLNVCYLMRI